jgi:hypothetical protein
MKMQQRCVLRRTKPRIASELRVAWKLQMDGQTF